jgi:hypothetical protein
LVGITRRLGRSSIAEIPKRKANFVETLERTIPLILLLPVFVATIFASKKGLFAIVVFSIFKLTYPTPTSNVR